MRWGCNEGSKEEIGLGIGIGIGIEDWRLDVGWTQELNFAPSLFAGPFKTMAGITQISKRRKYGVQRGCLCFAAWLNPCLHLGSLPTVSSTPS